MRLLVWNLFHGRSLPASRCELLGQFAGMLGAWEWDVALLQEVPPWWPPLLARATGAEQRTVLTSRNALLPLRRALARRRPEVMKSNGGASNAALVRGSILAHRVARLRTWPERRVAQLLRLRDGGVLANYHASSRAERAREELVRLRELALEWADGSPLIIAGDLNLRSPHLGGDFVHVAARDVDHLFARGYRPLGPADLLPREAIVAERRVLLSDHLPIVAELSAPAVP